MVIHKILVSVFLLTTFFALGESADAAVLRMRPSQAEVTVGNIVSVQVTVDTLGKVINNTESVIQFPTDLLEVVSIDNSSSIFSLWVENPNFSNAAGQASFNGGVPNPGFQGSSGNIASIVFRTKKAGTASVIFLNSAIRENDGLGTDILSGKIGSEITIRSSPVQPATTPKPPAEEKEPAPKPPAEEKEPATTTALRAPVITDVTAEVALGGVAHVAGSSIYHGATARLTLVSGETNITLDSPVGENGAFSISQPHTLQPGRYTGTIVIVKDGLESAPSEAFTIRFADMTFMQKLWEFFTRAEVTLLLSVLIAFALGLVTARYLFAARRRSRSVHDVLHHVDVEVHRAFLALRGEINAAIEDMREESTKRTLTQSETKFIRKMTTTIKETESVIDKDIQGADK